MAVDDRGPGNGTGSGGGAAASGGSGGGMNYAQAGLGAMSAWTGYQAQRGETLKQKLANYWYKKAYERMAAQGRNDEFANEEQLRHLSEQGGQYYQDLANTLNSDQRGVAGNTARDESYGSLENALTPVRGQTAVQDRGATFGGAAKNWGQLAYAQHAPRLAAQRGALGQEGYAYGQENYDRNALNTLGNQQIDVSRRRNESNRRLQQLTAYRQQLLGNQANALQYQGPGNSYYNQQLLAQGMNLAGSFAGSMGK